MIVITIADRLVGDSFLPLVIIPICFLDFPSPPLWVSFRDSFASLCLSELRFWKDLILCIGTANVGMLETNQYATHALECEKNTYHYISMAHVNEICSSMPTDLELYQFPRYRRR